MRYKLLGNTGLRVSEICLGTMTFGEDWGWGASKDESRRIFDAFFDAGGNFVDTANLYTNGTSESFIGEFMQGRRERTVLATKYTNAAPGNDPNAAGNHRKSMVQALEQSLKRLRTDYIDLYWLHIWDFLTPVEEVMRAFDDMVRSGKVLYAGISDAPAWVVARANTIAELRGWTPFSGLQIEYSLAERTPERDLLPMAEALQIAVTAWSPLAGGLLTGKYAGGSAAPKKPAGKSSGPAGGAPVANRLDNASMAEFSPVDDRKLAIADAVKTVANEVGRSPAQVALAWLRQRPYSVPVIPIVGARKLAQVQDNLACVDLKISGDHLRRLDEASRIDLGFPHDMFPKPMVRGFAYGGTFEKIDAR
jgi:aryl-alcohol dehydrogenase-like predicted oxidoreductase